MYFFEETELDFISVKLGLFIKKSKAMKKRPGILMDYSQLSYMVDKSALSESIIQELSLRLVEYDIIVIPLGSQFLILDGDELNKYKKLSKTMFFAGMKGKLCL